jgi:hypothetical protein
MESDQTLRILKQAEKGQKVGSKTSQNEDFEE